VDDGKVTAEAIKAELKANKVTGDLIPHASQFQFANRSVLSAQFPGGWYVSFRVPKGRSPEDIRARTAFHWIREHGLQIFGFTVKPKRARKATPTTFCTSCCGYGHNSWRCINRPLRCSLCAGAHSWAQHKCTFSGCQSQPGNLCSEHEKPRCFGCKGDHCAGFSGCQARPKRGDKGSYTGGTGSGPSPSPPSLW
jgi:hypothetical protein